MIAVEALMDPALERRIKSPPRAGPLGLKLTPDDLEAYLDDLARKGRVTGTLADALKGADLFVGSSSYRICRR